MIQISTGKDRGPCKGPWILYAPEASTSEKYEFCP
jgi:hypothetical protein